MAESRAVRSAGQGSEASAMVVVAKAVGPTTPKKATAWFLWLLGLYVMLMAQAPVHITPEMEAQYMKIMEKAETYRDLRGPVLFKLRGVDAKIYEQTGGIPLTWRLNPEKAKIVNGLYEIKYGFERELMDIEGKIDAVESDAKSELGLWSSRGLSEVREKFWEKVDAGKAFAKRQTLWDAVVSVLFNQRRDEEAFSFIVRWVFTIAFNFTIGFVLTLVNFTFSLIYVVRSFQPSFMSGLLFYFIALLGATSVVVGYLMLTVGIAGGGVYVAYKTVSANARLQNRRRHTIRHEHYE